MGADIVDVNMGCPVPKIAKHNAGCSLMREPDHAAPVSFAPWSGRFAFPVTVKMRAGWNEHEINAPVLARMVAGRRRGRGGGARPDRGAVVQRRVGLVAHRARRRRASQIPVFGSGDCVEAGQVVVAACATAASPACSSDEARSAIPGSSRRRREIAGRRARRQPSRSKSAAQFLLDYIDLLLRERVGEAEGFRHVAPGSGRAERSAGARARALGDQQAARARKLVFKGTRRRDSVAANGHQFGRLDCRVSGTSSTGIPRQVPRTLPRTSNWQQSENCTRRGVPDRP